MVRREIRRFELILGEERIECAVPFSVKSILASREGATIPSGSIVFESKIHVDNVALVMKNFYIRIKGISSPARIYVGETLIGRIDGVTPVYNLDLSGILSHGDNILSVRFDEGVSGMESIGISEPFEILRFSGAIIETVSLRQHHTDGEVRLDVSLNLIGDPTATRAVATLVSSVGRIYYTGLTAGKGSIVIPDPLYWWPNGQGVQNLYKLTVNLYGESDIEDTAELRLGLRTVKAIEGGRLSVNGVNVIPMGAVHIPESDTDISSVDDRARDVVKAAAMSGYNCLVIPEGASRPTEKFFELCDTYGIMLIMEHTQVDESICQAMKHKAMHPSLCLIDLIGEGDRKGEIEFILKHAPDVAVSRLKEVPDYLGKPSLPSMKTIRALVPEEERSLFSHAIESIAEEGAIRAMLLSVAERYPYPADLSEFAYASALASAHKVGEFIRDGRLMKGESGRAIFYRLCDTEPQISSSAIDCRGRWKPLQYFSGRHFAPVAVYASYNEGSISFSVSNHRRDEVVGALEYFIKDASNTVIFKDSFAVGVPSMSHADVHTVRIEEYIKGHEREYYLEFYLKEGSFSLSKTTMLFVPEKHFIFKKPKIKSVITGEGESFSVTISSDVFIKDMEISFDGVDAIFDDNYFDITSEAPVRVSFRVKGGLETSYRLKDAIELRSVGNVIK